MRPLYVAILMIAYLMGATAFCQEESNPSPQQLEQGLEMVNQRIKEKQSDAEAFMLRGFIQQHMGHYRESIEDFGKAIRLNPKKGEPYIGRACTYGLTGEWDKMISDSTIALQINPNDDLSLNNRAAGYIQKKQYALAMKDVKQAIKLNPHRAAYQESMGEILYRTGQYALALKYFDTSISMDSKLGESYYFRGLTNQQMHNPAQSKKDLETATSLGYKPGSINIEQVHE